MEGHIFFLNIVPATPEAHRNSQVTDKHVLSMLTFQFIYFANNVSPESCTNEGPPVFC